MKIKSGDIVRVKGFKSLFEVVQTGTGVYIVTDDECDSEWNVSANILTLVCKRENREDLENDSNGR